MRIIEPKVEYWNCGFNKADIMNHIARCTRVCYQSESIEGEPSDTFVRRTALGRGHHSVLEHGSVYLITNENHVADFFYNNPYSKVVCTTVGYCVTTNVRVLHENDMMYLLDDARIPTKHHVKRVSVSITTNIGVSRELNRHRCHSISEESTRYCNYSCKRFDKSLTFVLNEAFATLMGFASGEVTIKGDKVYLDGDEFHIVSEDVVDYLRYLKSCEDLYLKYVMNGYVAQEARGILPLDLKTQVIHTAFIPDWDQFIDLRFKEKTGKVHPDMQYVAEEIKNIIYQIKSNKLKL